MSMHEGKVALVTGGASGIGAAIVQKLRDEGAVVFTAQRRQLDDANALVIDLDAPSSVPAVIAEVISRAGRLDILVNNAGIMFESPTEAQSLEDWERCLRVNLTSPFMLIREALPHLAKTNGAIVNTGSIEGLGANPGHAAYGASKAGLHGLTTAVAVDAGRLGVRCNAVAPGWIDTALNDEFVAAQPDADGFRLSIGKMHPVGRSGQPEEVAALVSFLASEQAGFITGEIYRIDGGRMSKLPLPS